MNEVSLNVIKEAIGKFNNGIKPNVEYCNKEKWQSYFTPTELARQMQKYAKISDADKVLDPSAGTGNLVDNLQISKENIFLVEPNGDYCEILRRKGYINIINSTFEDAIENGLLPKNISRIIMNPPFSNQLDLKHISLAYDLVSEDGIVVGVLGKNSISEKDANNRMSSSLKNFKKICRVAYVCQLIPLPAGTFKAIGTICDTLVVVLEKGKEKNKK